MARNIEIKARCNDPERCRKLAARFSDKGPEILHQADTFFYCNDGRLKLREFGDGTGELNLDCLLRIPMDEGYAFIRDATSIRTLYLCQSPKDETQAVVYYTTTSQITDTPVMEAFNWTLPPGDVNIIIAWAQDGSSDFTDTMTVCNNDGGAYYERWITLRGAE